MSNSHCTMFNPQDRVVIGVATLRDLILTRPAVQEQFLAVLLQLTGHKKEAVCLSCVYMLLY